MKPILLVTCTKDNNFDKRPLYKSIQQLEKLYTKNDFQWEVIKNNKTGLSTTYNRFLTSKYKDFIVLFCHDDVVIDTLFLKEFLNKSPYVVTGLAGTTEYTFKDKAPAWHLMSERQNLVGEVKHIKDNTIWTTIFGKTVSSAKLIDGLFIAIDVEKILKTKARFNEKYTFHHYDLALCLECLQHDVSIGIMPINVIHHGLGDSMLTQEWETSAKKFTKEYGNS
jgi:GT2 family glycosyltransferase